MATENDIQVAALRRAAEHVIREYRQHHELEASDSPEGMLVTMRLDLARALDDLESALDGDRPLRARDTQDTVSVSDRIDALDSAREAAHEAVYEIRGLIGAAELLAEEGTGDERLQVLLRISLAKLKALSEALDIVNFGKVPS